MESLLDIYKELEQLGFVIRPFKEEDAAKLYEIFRAAVEAEGEFHYQSSSIEEFRLQFLQLESHVYVCESSSSDICGGFYIRANDSSTDTANAAYMVAKKYRRKGIGKLLVKASLHLARELGFHAMQFNNVLVQNNIAVALYKKLGFTIVQTMPQAYIMYKKIDDL